MVSEIDADRVVSGLLAVPGDDQFEVVSTGHAHLAAIGSGEFVERGIVMGESAVTDGH